MEQRALLCPANKRKLENPGSRNCARESQLCMPRVLFARNSATIVAGAEGARKYVAHQLLNAARELAQLETCFSQTRRCRRRVRGGMLGWDSRATDGVML